MDEDRKTNVADFRAFSLQDISCKAFGCLKAASHEVDTLSWCILFILNRAAFVNLAAWDALTDLAH